MEHLNNGKGAAFLCGIGGGMTKYIMQFNDAPYFARLLEAGVTAFICGFLGMAGKWGWDYLKNKYGGKKNV
jgi:hypothetical protein